MEIQAHNDGRVVTVPGDTLVQGNFDGLNLHRAHLKGMDMRSATFRNAILANVDFRDAQL